MEEKRMTKMVGYGQQGAWTKWDKIDRRKVSWFEFWKTGISRKKFLVKMVYDLWPSPTNLHVWGETEIPNCPLCPEKGSLQHILSSCKIALAEGRYRWRHGKVLEAISLIITEALQRNKFFPGKSPQICETGDDSQRETKSSPINIIICFHLYISSNMMVRW